MPERDGLGPEAHGYWLTGYAWLEGKRHAGGGAG